MEEVWKDIQGYEGLYQVSNTGKVKSLNYLHTNKPRCLVPKCNNGGRLWVELYNHGDKKQFLIHRLVAQEFIDNPNNFPQVNHIDENTKNNCVDNLEWCTGKYNVQSYCNNHKCLRKKFGKYKNHKWANQKICQNAKTGEVKIWSSARQIECETKFRASSIIECCKGKRKTAYGFTWQFAN